MRFGFRYGRLTRWLLAPFFMGPRHSWIEVRPDEISVRMGFAFRAQIPRTSIAGIRAVNERPLSIGAHGWDGRWLVNASRQNVVTFDLDPPVKARFNGIPITVRQLKVSPEDPDGFVNAVQAPLPGTIR